MSSQMQENPSAQLKKAAEEFIEWQRDYGFFSAGAMPHYQEMIDKLNLILANAVLDSTS